MSCILKNMATLETHELSSGTFTIGRRKNSHLCLEDRSISREHCEIHVEENQVLVHDLDSRSGVFVNSKKVNGSEPLNDSDILELGLSKFEVKLSSEEDPDETLVFNTEKTAVLNSVTETTHTSLTSEDAGASSISLKLTDSKKKKHALRISNEGVLVGRSIDCDLRLQHASISVKHAKIVKQGARIFVKDLI